MFINPTTDIPFSECTATDNIIIGNNSPLCSLNLGEALDFVKYGENGFNVLTFDQSVMS